VEGAKSVGFGWSGRHRNALGVGEISLVKNIFARGSPTESHEVAFELPFSSDRKRMSVICPNADGGATVLTKGADCVMEQRLAHALPLGASSALSEFARGGFRTLVLGRRSMDAQAYAAWQLQFERANAAIHDNRADLLDNVYSLAERDLEYMGITALEDRLQDGVPRSIKTLRDAGIRVWVLTGDKVETAVEIAKSCALFEEGMEIVRVLGATSSRQAVSAMRCFDATRPAARGIVLDGCSVTQIFKDSEAQQTFSELALSSSSCVCCRLSPLQKRKLVEFVRKEKPDAITLAVGDGANDVPMIQGAHVGVGIRGKEGGAAVQASDIAISQFRFLSNLTLCHGRKAYRRIAEFLCYFMYKSVAVGWPFIIHSFIGRFKGRVPFAPILDATYAPLTSWSVALVLAFDCDYPDEIALESPYLYSYGLKRKGLNTVVFARWMATASLHGIVAWLVPMFVHLTAEDCANQTIRFWMASFSAFTILVFTVHLKLILMARGKVGRVGGAVIVSELLAFVLCTAVMGVVAAENSSPILSLSPKCSNCVGDENIPLDVVSDGQDVLWCMIVPLFLIAFDWWMQCVRHALHPDQ